MSKKLQLLRSNSILPSFNDAKTFLETISTANLLEGELITCSYISNNSTHVLHGLVVNGNVVIVNDVDDEPDTDSSLPIKSSSVANIIQMIATNYATTSMLLDYVSNSSLENYTIGILEYITNLNFVSYTNSGQEKYIYLSSADNKNHIYIGYRQDNNGIEVYNTDYDRSINVKDDNIYRIELGDVASSALWTSDIALGTGQTPNKLMSLKAITDALNTKLDVNPLVLYVTEDSGLIVEINPSKVEIRNENEQYSTYISLDEIVVNGNTVATENYVNSKIVLATGSSTTSTMSQNAITTALNTKLNTNGKAASAVKADTLTTGRTIALDTAAIGTATSFNGSANITIPVTNIKEAYLTLGGKNISGSTSAYDVSLVDTLKANRFALINADYVTVETSSDSGSTWTNANLTKANKAALFGQLNNSNYSVLNPSAAASAQVRVTIEGYGNVSGAMGTVGCGTSTDIRKFIIYMMRCGTGTKVTIEGVTFLNLDTWVKIAENVSISGYPGMNVINLNNSITFGTVNAQSLASKYRYLRFTFSTTSTTRMTIGNIFAYGGVGNHTPGSMALTGHLYSYDSNGNATFPGTVSNSSDIKLKENINTITEDIDKAANIEIKEFNLINDSSKTKRYGVIALEVELAGLENLVTNNISSDYEFNFELNEEIPVEAITKAVDYTSLLCLKVKALENRIQELENRINNDSH